MKGQTFEIDQEDNYGITLISLALLTFIVKTNSSYVNL